MELGAFAAALVRRWYLVVVAAIIASGACVYTASAMGPTYETNASVLLFPPMSDTEATGEQASSNPYLELSGLTTARDIVIRRLTSQSARDYLAESHPDADYRLVPDATSAGPLIIVEVSGPTARSTLSAQTDLMAEFADALDDLQGGLGLSRAEFITARILTSDTRAQAVHKGQVRAGIVVTVAVLGLFLALIAMFDGMMAARSSRPRSEPREKARPKRRPRRRWLRALPVDGDGARGEGTSTVPSADTGTGVGSDDEPDTEPDDAEVYVPTPAPIAAFTPRTPPSRATRIPKGVRKEARRLARDEAVRQAKQRARQAEEHRSHPHDDVRALDPART